MGVDRGHTVAMAPDGDRDKTPGERLDRELDPGR